MLYYNLSRRRMTGARPSLPVLLLGMSFILGFLVEPGGALANGLGENRPWQFSSTLEQAQKAGITALIEQKKGGGFRSYYRINNNATYNIAGDYNDCGVSASTTGNSNGASQSSIVGSPTISSAPGFSALAQGNVNDTLQGGAGSNVNASGAGSANPVSNNTQDNTAPQTATVDQNTVTTSVGTSTGSGTGSPLSLDSVQSNDGAALNSSVASSTACSFANGSSGGAQ
ncbi:MAG: hypothetical protein KDC18_04270 [Alphaproteobacteria bacterium]|nr:hypothetical protein [Alphaproteobacteria bacterium]